VGHELLDQSYDFATIQAAYTTSVRAGVALLDTAGMYGAGEGRPDGRGVSGTPTVPELCPSSRLMNLAGTLEAVATPRRSGRAR
jgi:hypothetical protein